MTVFVGEQIQSGFGSWTDNPTRFEYQWQVSDNGTSGWVDVSGATRSDHICSASDEGKFFKCLVTASNSSGSTEVSSGAVGPVGIYVPPEEPFVRRVTLLSGVKSTTSDVSDDVRDVDKGWSIY